MSIRVFAMMILLLSGTSTTKCSMILDTVLTKEVGENRRGMSPMVPPNAQLESYYGQSGYSQYTTGMDYHSVSSTHLTLPTTHSVLLSVAPVSLYLPQLSPPAVA